MEDIKEDVKYSYAAVHIAVHLLLAGLLYFVVQPDLLFDYTAIDYTKLVIIAFGTAVVDLDHVLLWKERGIRGYLRLRAFVEYGKPRRYKFHNLLVLFAAFGGSLSTLVYDYFLIGLFFVAIALHLLWDLFEDLVIFKMGYGHWI